MSFERSARSQNWLERIRAFMDAQVIPAIPVYHEQLAAIDRWAEIPPIFDELKAKARAEGLWNLFMPPSEHDDEYFTSVGLSNVEYAPIAELMGRVSFASEVFNCMAPDTGNFEVLHRYGTPAQKKRFMVPLRDGETRSAFLMTEPDVASSDARNIQTAIRRDSAHYVINGRKWWSSGAGHPRCDFFIVMGKTDPGADAHRQQSMILVPRDAAGVEIVRHLPTFGYQDQHGHSEIVFTDVRVPASNLLGAEGDGFAIAQARLGPGRVHHCMRLIGMAERAVELMVERARSRRAFGGPLSDQGVVREQIALSRLEIEQARLLVLKTAWLIDRHGGAKAAATEIAGIKVVVPRMACTVIDRAMQVHGGAAMSDDFPLASFYAGARALRFADGPDEVHLRTVARHELHRH